jgi:hypothetical protein
VREATIIHLKTMRDAMFEIFGAYSEEVPEGEYLMLGFSPGSIPLKQRWRTNGLSADFIADYLQTFFIGKESTNNDAPIPAQSKNAVKYIANELLENAMKFNDDNSPYQTCINFNLHVDKLVFKITNSINDARAEQFKDFIRRLLAADPQEMYIEQMEANAMADSEGHSGLGFLSMICDYSARLGWKFEREEDAAGVLRSTVTTLVTLDI